MRWTSALLLGLALLSGGCADGDGDDDGGATSSGPRMARSTSRLVAALEQDPDGLSGALVEALAGVAEKPAADALPHLLPLTTHLDEEVRFNVVLALQAMDGEQARAALAGMAADDESELVRLEAGGG